MYYKPVTEMEIFVNIAGSERKYRAEERIQRKGHSEA
jgi:hypothetical protein